MDLYLARLPRVLQHLSILLNDRGYSGFPHSDTTDAVQLATSKGVSIGEALTCAVKNEQGVQLAVCFLDPIFDVAKAKEVMTSSYQLHGVLSAVPEGQNAIAVCFSKLSPDATKESQKLRKRLQVLTFRNLAFPLSRHVLVPRHVALTPDEAAEFETSRKLERSKLPHLKMVDPVRIWYGWPKGTIVRIDRPSGSVWRCVR